MKDVLIITGTPEANVMVDEIIAKYFVMPRWCGANLACAETAFARGFIDNAYLHGFSKDGQPFRGTIYHHSELTPAIVATFPGARELPPDGSWEYKGVELSVDGEEKKPVVPGLYYINQGGYARKSYSTFLDNGPNDPKERWILKPIISPELLAARERLTACAETVAESAVARRKAVAADHEAQTDLSFAVQNLSELEGK